jgi:site-specific DNA-methyltransferase (adenine-specific)
MRPYYEEAGVTIYHGDCREMLSGVRPVCDVLCTDPPYASAAATATTGWARQKWGGNWGDMSILTMLAELVLDSAALSPIHEAVWFADHLGYAALIPSFFRRYQVVQSVVWDRDMLGMGAYFRKQTEMVIYARHTDSALFRVLDARDLIRLRPSSAEKEHPAQKPLDLLIALLSPLGGQRVLDPFAGTGTTLLAAKQLGRQAIGIEIEERYCEIAAKRLSQGVLSFTEARSPYDAGLGAGREATEPMNMFSESFGG